jgi:ABC-type multidrug transport system fused ATPase/permease subunit
MGGQVTVIMIAHRLNTVKNCDKIFLLDNGTIKRVGDFETLCKSNHLF